MNGGQFFLLGYVCGFAIAVFIGGWVVPWGRRRWGSANPFAQWRLRPFLVDGRPFWEAKERPCNYPLNVQGGDRITIGSRVHLVTRAHTFDTEDALIKFIRSGFPL